MARRLFYRAKMCAVNLTLSIKIGHSDLYLGSRYYFITTIALTLKCSPFQDGENKSLDIIQKQYMTIGNFMDDLVLTEVKGQGHSAHSVNFGCERPKIFKIEQSPI